MNRQKIFIVAGEDSGDLHGSKLIISLKKLNPNIDLYGIGGSRMEKEGLKLTEHIKNLNVIGIFEVLRHYRKIKAIFSIKLLITKSAHVKNKNHFVFIGSGHWSQYPTNT